VAPRFLQTGGFITRAAAPSSRRARVMKPPGCSPEVDMSSTTAFANAPELAVKTLACAVIKQALADALDPTTPLDVRRDAEQFLAGDAWFRRWCVAAGLAPIRLISRRHAA
jgi:hypothetical protein